MISRALVLFAFCLFAGGQAGSIEKRSSRMNDDCAVLLMSCRVPTLPQTRASLYTSDGNVNIDCSAGKLQEERNCVEGINRECPDNPNRSRFQNMLEIKEYICNNRTVVISGRECMEEADSTQVLRDCYRNDLCDPQCIRNSLATIESCLREHVDFAIGLAAIYTRNENLCQIDQQVHS